MKTDWMSRMYAMVASLALAVMATFGVAVTMTTTGDVAWNEASAKAAAATAIAQKSAPALTEWKAPVATTSRQVM